MAANQHEVTRHARQVHNGPKPLSCPYCDYKTADRSNFKKHVELHLNPRQFLCPLCKYAASKKCNLKYHIKSRHAGCDVSVDVSNVKLRVKKTEPGGLEENANTKTNKHDSSSCVEEDFDDDDVEEEDEEEEMVSESIPINLSIRKSSRSSVSQPSEMPEKSSKKGKVCPEKDKAPKPKDKVEPEKKVSTRQKKTENRGECVAVATGTQAETPTAIRRRFKKSLVVHEQEAVALDVQDQPETKTEKPDQARAKDERTSRQKKEEQKAKPQKDKEQKNDNSGKENKSVNKSRRSGSKKSETIPDTVEETQQKPEAQEKVQKEKTVKDRAGKRKISEVLDLSSKSSPEAVVKPKRLKTATTTKKVVPEPASGASTTVKTFNPMQKATETVVTCLEKKEKPDNKQTCLRHKDIICSRTSQVPEGSTHKDDQLDTEMCEHPPTPTQSPQVSENLSEKMETPPTCSSSGEDTPTPTKDCTAPTFLKPTSPPPLLIPSQRNKPADPEDDEGIHSSHEGGSDISDSASEGSDDSGLNGARSGKMANDPETPTEEIPTPTELKGHLCIFCDRTFPMEVAYRRHLNRHLVNVYYINNSANAQK